ncbi:hypothetical protein C8R44DRAFT_811159 [Mycena epipterygia]|nr:hypothetical protein C8R44DRAFT_811159 [Mycena epipterygia]
MCLQVATASITVTCAPYRHPPNCNSMVWMWPLHFKLGKWRGAGRAHYFFDQVSAGLTYYLAGITCLVANLLGTLPSLYSLGILFSHLNSGLLPPLAWILMRVHH